MPSKPAAAEPSTALAAQLKAPFAEQVTFFRGKLGNLVPTARWDDLWQAQHDKAFMVAGAAKADLLADLAGAVDKAIADGETLDKFRSRFKDIVGQHGWHGWTGEGSQAGQDWRTRIIYQTNLAASYSAGRLAQLRAAGYTHYMYKHSDSVSHPRPQHLALNGVVEPAESDFWRRYYPPNGWGCRCRALGVRGPAQAKRLGGQWDKGAPGWTHDTDPKTGAPPGIDKGWGYMPGGSVAGAFQPVMVDKLARLPAPLGAALAKELAPALLPAMVNAFAKWADDVASAGVTRNTMQTAGAMQVAEIEFLTRLGKPPLSAELVVEDRLLVGKKANRHARDGDALTLDEWKSVPAQLVKQANVYYDKTNGSILYVMPALTDSRSIKLAVEVNFETAAPKRVLNMARAGFKINVQALQDRTRYVEIR